MKKVKYLLFLFFVLCLTNAKALSLNQTEYEKYGIKRAYVICDYVFDLSKHNPTLKDFMLASQSCPTDRISIIEIKISQDLSGKTTRTYQDLLTGTKYGTFPTLNVRYIYSSAIGSDEKKNTVDETASEVFHDIETKIIDQKTFDSYNVKRAYIVGAYIFDLAKHNPTLRDLMLAAQSDAAGSVSIVEAKTSTNLNGEITKAYQELLSGRKLASFPEFNGRYIFGSAINPVDHNKETRTDLLTGETINNGTSDPVVVPKEEEQTDPTDPRNKTINYKTKCMGYLTVANTNNVVSNICIRWKDKSKYSGAEANNVNTGLYTLPVSNYPNVKNGNLVIAGHSGTAAISYFKTLHLTNNKTNNKATIKFNGNTYTYYLKNYYLVPKTGVVKITRNSSRTTLTLITCTKTASGKNDEAHQTVYIYELHDIDGKEYQ